MDTDDDLARLLPEPPPPRPSRRDAAIAAAMQRFNGTMAPSPTPGVVVRERRPSPTWWGRPTAQLGAAMSVMLVAVISAAIALRTPDGRFEGARGTPGVVLPPSRPAPSAEPGTTRADDAATCDRCANDRDGRPAAKALAAASAPPRAAPVPASVGESGTLDRSASEARSTEDRLERAKSFAPAAPAPAPVAAPSPPPPAPPPPPSPVVAADAPASVSAPPASKGRALARRAALTERADEPGANDIVVTAMRVRASPRGDWNACTVNDPQQALRKCKQWIGRDVSGPGMHISEGLTLAWRGDWTGAANAFTQAISMKPRSGFAYLNRGLAYQRVGDLARAAADLDLAVRYDADARSYYNRAGIRRALGDEQGGQIDAAHAVALDPSYLGVVE